jgi:MYXO-CTERM domain-containing protein
MTRPVAVITAALVFAAAAQESAAICRIVGEAGKPPPVIQPKQSVLFIKRTDVEVACDEPGSDAGADAAGADAGADAGAADAGPGEPIEPFECQVIPEAITMVVQPRFTTRSDGAAFALLMVTPAPAHIQLERDSIFTDLAEATAPEVEVKEIEVEDERLGYQCDDPYFKNGGGCGWDPGPSGGGGGNFDSPDGPEYHDPETDTVETVGPYAVARITATTAGELAESLTALGYIFVQADIDAIAPYLELGFQAVAVRIDTTAELIGAGLEPLSFTYPGTEMRLPLGISRQLVASQTSIALYTLAEGRYEFPGSTVSYARYNRGEFLTRSNLIATLDQGPEADPIAARVPGDPTFVDTVVVTQEIRIPSSDCPRRERERESGCGCNTSGGGNALLLLITLGLVGVLTRRRRRAAR